MTDARSDARKRHVVILKTKKAIIDREAAKAKAAKREADRK